MSRISRFLLLIAAIASNLLFSFSSVSAATTCGAATSEAGGSHKRCSSSNGVFHTWTASGFDASKPGSLVVYVHGWNDQCAKPSTQDADDGVPDTWFNTAGAVYVDAVWPAHTLAQQFASGGIPNTLYVAVQAKTCGTSITPKDPAHVDKNLHWSNFNTLLTDLGSAGVGVPNGTTILIGHSGAYETLSSWQSSSQVSHVVHLDTLYVDSGFSAWLKASGHTATVISTQGETGAKYDQIISGVSDAVKLTSMPSGISSMDEAGKRARVLGIKVASSPTHMQLVTGGSAIPMALQRVSLAGTAPAKVPAETAPPPSSAGSGSALPSGPIEAPRLEIPIPGLTLTSITDPNDYSIPWIGQYVSGVYTFLLSIIGLVAAVMMIIGGFEYLSSAGDSGRIGRAKKRIVDAISGLVLALGSYVLLYTINPALVQFEGLKIFSVQTELIGAFSDGAPPPPPSTDGTQAPQTPPPPASGSSQRTCSDTATCLPYCRKANCTTVLCYPGNKDCPPTNLPGFEGVTLRGVNDPRKSDCVLANFPSIPPGAPVKPITWPGIHNIVPNGQQASQLVIDGLLRAEKYIDDNYGGQNLKISLSNCYRDTRLDFSWQCTEIMRPPPSNNPVNFGSTWPGSNPHSSGYACDLALVKSGKTISGHMGNQSCASVAPGNKLLLEILTNPLVGAKRLGYEAWHFNWGGFNPCYCPQTGQCPLSPRIGDCSGEHLNSKC